MQPSAWPILFALGSGNPLLRRRPCTGRRAPLGSSAACQLTAVKGPTPILGFSECQFQFQFQFLFFSSFFCFCRMAAWLDATPGPCGRCAACADAARPQRNAPRLSAAAPLRFHTAAPPTHRLNARARPVLQKRRPKTAPKAPKPLGSHFRSLARCSATLVSHPTIHIPFPSLPSSSSRRPQGATIRTQPSERRPSIPRLTRPLHSQPSTLGAWESCIHRRPTSSIRFVALLGSVLPPTGLQSRLSFDLRDARGSWSFNSTSLLPTLGASQFTGNRRISFSLSLSHHIPSAI